MKILSLRTHLLLLVCGSGVAALGALRPDGDTIEFSPPREELKVPPLTGSDPDRRTFNFQRREPGSSVSEVPAAVALPAPDQVNRMRALQDLIDQRSAWARPEEAGSELGMDLKLQPKGADTEVSIDDLFDRQNNNRLDRGLDRRTESDTSSFDRSRDEGLERGSWDRRGPNSRDLRDRTSDRDLDRRTDSLTDPTELRGEEEGSGLDLTRSRRDTIESSRDPISGVRRGSGDGLFEFGSLVPKSGGFIRDANRDMPTREDRMDSLRRVLGTSAATILGGSVSGGVVAPGSADGLGAGGGLYGTIGSVPGANRSLSQALDGRPGGTVTTPSPDGASTGERFTGVPNRPFGLDGTTGREGFGSRAERPLMAPPPTPMEMFRKKHDARIPMRDF